MNEKCLIIGHLNIEDLLTINGIIRYYSTKYIITYLLCKIDNLKSIVQMYSDNKSIIPIAIDTNNYYISNDSDSDSNYIYNIYSEIDIIKLGVHNNNWFLLKSDLLIGNLPYSFFKTFYQQIDLEYDSRYIHEKINRNHLNELNFYNSVSVSVSVSVSLSVIDLNKKYIFSTINDKHIKQNINKNPIFNPKTNNIKSDNLLDYSYILENAHEIHVNYCDFFALCVFLDLSNVKNKYIYTNISNIKDYHKSTKDWTLIYDNE